VTSMCATMRAVQRGRRSLVALGFLICAMAGAPAGARAQTPEPPVVASVGATPQGQPMGQSFLGVSLEYNALHIYTGRDPRHVNPVLIQLLRNLDPGQTPVVRIGGNSADFSWWPIKGTLPPVGVRYALTNGWVRMTQAFATKLRAKLIMGLNLAGGRPAIAAAEARAFLSGINHQNLEGFEIGNEPDLYATSVWFHDRKGRQLFARAPTYDFSDYLLDVARWRSALPPLTFIGPALAQLTWLDNIDQIRAAEPGLPMVTVHRYPLRACPTPATSPQFATIPNLLSDTSSTGMADRMIPFISLVHSRATLFRVDELNSVSCSGKRGVSDTFASALWMLDTLFALAQDGVDSVNVHTLPGAAYELFTISHTKNVWSAFVHPEYYAMLMFAQAFPPGAQLLPVNEPAGPVKVWATRAPDGRTRVVIINKDAFNVQTAQVSVPGAGGSATLDWLRAPSVLATGGVTLGSQSFGSATRTGLLQPAELAPIAASGGTYSIELPAGSAVMLTQ
jgi:hypothetical protein